VSDLEDRTSAVAASDHPALTAVVRRMRNDQPP
jgi:hypothetical protein